jgi:predicted nucleic acid-binding protein
MILVVDAEVIFAALIARGFTLQLIKILSDHGVDLISPDYVSDEIRRRKDKIIRFSGLNEAQLDFVLNLIFERIKIISSKEYIQYFEEAGKLAPHKIDIPYFALALAKNSAIWSNEKSFKQQSKVKILSTNELKKMFL